MNAISPRRLSHRPNLPGFPLSILPGARPPGSTTFRRNGVYCSTRIPRAVPAMRPPVPQVWGTGSVGTGGYTSGSPNWGQLAHRSRRVAPRIGGRGAAARPHRVDNRPAALSPAGSGQRAGPWERRPENIRTCATAQQE